MISPRRQVFAAVLIAAGTVNSVEARSQSASSASDTDAQQAQGSAEAPSTVETLPEVVVTSPSPVKKRVARKAIPRPSAPAGAGSSAAKGPAQAQTGPDEAPAPEIAGSQTPAGSLVIADDAFAPVTVVLPSEIEAKQGQTIADTLSTKPGINASAFAPGSSRPIVRGLDNYRVRVQENGIGTHDVSALSEDHAVPVDPYAAERVEVIRGPATLRYGSQAIGGVVAIENNRVPSFMPRGGFAGALLGGWGSVDDGRDGSFRATAGANGVVVHADGFKRQSEDYRTPQGIVENSFVDSEGAAAGAALVGNGGFIGAAVSRVESLYGIPGEEARIDLEQDKILSKGEWRIGSGGIDAVRFWFGASGYQHIEVVGEEIGSRFTNDEQEGRAEVQHSPIATQLGEVDGAFGLQISHRLIEAESFEGSSLLKPAETDSFAAFMFEELSVSDRLRLQAAGRIEYTQVEGSGLTNFSDPLNLEEFTGEKAFTSVGLSTGLLYEFSGGIVGRLTGQYVERAPDAAELFSQGLHEATETFEIGNPNLEKEKATTVEAGVKKSSGDFRFDASAFYTHYDGFIAKVLTGIGCGDTIDTCGVDDELDQLLFQQRDANFYGVEAIAQLDIAPVWKGVWGIEGQYDFVRAQFEEGGNVPRIPPHRLGGGLYYRDGSWFARASALHAFEQNRIAQNETPTSGYTLVSAEMSYTTRLETWGGPENEFTIGVKGENLLDDDVRNHSSFKKDDVLQPGASVRVFGKVLFP